MDWLKEHLSERGVFVVKVCNTARGQSWDFDWSEVYPQWDWINALRAGTMSEEAFSATYKAMLARKHDTIVADLLRIKKMAGRRMIVLTCHEPSGEFCHRSLLLDFLWEIGAIRALLNRDVLVCKACYEYEADSRGDAFTEDEWNLIIGYVTHGHCMVCSGDNALW